MTLQQSLPVRRPGRAWPRRIWRGAAALLLAAAAALAFLALTPAQRDTGASISAQTSFDYVAVFAPGTSSAQVEQWRNAVLRVHESACLQARACIARSLRGAALGPQQQFAIGFDLMPDAAPNERAALLAAAQQALPGVRLVASSSLARAAE